MFVCAHVFESETEMNRRGGSHTVLTGRPGTIALNDLSDWVHMRIKNALSPSIFPFSPLFHSLSLSLTLPPLSSFPFYVFVFFCTPPSLLFCLLLPLLASSLRDFTLFWVRTGCTGVQNICFSSLLWVHLSSGSPLSHSGGPVELIWKLWSACPLFCCF